MVHQNIIFSYRLSDAWGAPISRVSVTGQEKRNLVCELANGENDPLIKTLPIEVLNQIARVTATDDRIASIDADDLVGDNGGRWVLDGHCSFFTFWCRGASRPFTIPNASCLRGVKTRNAGYVLKKFNQVAMILARNGVDREKYLRLG